MNLVNRLIDRLQAKYPPNRAVAILTPIIAPIIATVAAWLSAWAPEHLPGLPAFSAGQLTAFGLLGAGAVLAAAVKLADRYIDGWQYDEARKYDAEQERLGREHELRLAILNSEAPHTAIDALDLISGGAKSQPTPAPESPSAAISGVVPPPPPSPGAGAPSAPSAAIEGSPMPEEPKGDPSSTNHPFHGLVSTQPGPPHQQG